MGSSRGSSSSLGGYSWSQGVFGLCVGNSNGSRESGESLGGHA